MSNVWQNILACDAMCNPYRAPNNPYLKTLYLRRRALLLQEKSKKHSRADDHTRKLYLQHRASILHDRYGLSKEALCFRSRSVSSRGMSISSADMKNPSTLEERYMAIQHMLDQHQDAISNLAFSKDEKSVLAVSSMDGKISICQIKPICKVLYVLSGHATGVTDIQWSGGSEWLLSCSLDTTLRLWDAQSGRCFRIFYDPAKSPLNCCTFLPSNNNLIVAGNKRGMVQVLNISTGIFPLNGGSQVGASVTCLTCDGVGKLIWTGDSRGYINSFIVDPATGRLTKGRRLEIQPSIRSQGPVITSISFTAWTGRGGHDPTLLISCTANSLFLYGIIDEHGGIRLKRRCQIPHHQSKIRSEFCHIASQPGAWCPNIVSGSEDCSVYFLNVDSISTTTRKIPAHSSPVLSVATSCDGTYFASGDSRGIIMIWSKLV